MSIEQSLERIAVALEKIAGVNRVEIRETISVPVVEQPKKPRRMKDAAIPAQQAAAETDVVPGLEDNGGQLCAAPDVLRDDPGPKTGAELRAQAQKYIVAADKLGLTEKLVTFIQSVAKIFSPTEPKLIKIPEAKVPEAAKMIADWCLKNGIAV